MKKYFIFFLALYFLIGCTKATKSNNENLNYKEEMRYFIENISDYAKSFKPNIYIIPQNGHNLITQEGTISSSLVTDYLDAISGLGREDLFYGYNQDNEETPLNETNEMIKFLDLARNYGKKILVTDYCYTISKVDSSYQKNFEKGYISFAANHRELDNIPNYPSRPFNSNTEKIDSLYKAKNFLYLINTQNYETKEQFISDITKTDYDLIITDLFFNDTLFTSEEISRLKVKSNGQKRLLICYMSIGEAEDYRYYWKDSWSNNPPNWLCEENPNWEGNYKVKYWDKEWQNIIFGNPESYTKKIVDAGFDGIYLDLVDAFEYFENK